MSESAPSTGPSALLSRLSGQALHYLVASGMAAGLQFATVAVVTRIFTREEYGSFALFQSLATFVAAMAALNFQQSVKRYRLEDTDDFASFLRTTGAFLVVANALVLGVAVLVREPAGRALGLSGAVLVFATAVGVGRVPWLMMWQTLVAEMRSFAYARLSVGRDLAVFGAIAIGGFWAKQNGGALWGSLWGALGATSLIGLAVAVWLVGRSKTGKLDAQHLRYAVAFGFPLIPSTIATAALNLLDRFMIQAHLGGEDTALYSFSYNIGMVLSIATVAVAQAYVPIFTKLRDADRRPEIEAAWSRVLAALLILAFGLVLFAREAALILGERSYLVGLSIVPWVVLGYYARAIAALAGAYAIYHKRTWINGAGNVLAAVINGIANWLLIPKYGYAAAAWTTFGSFVFLMLWYMATSRVVLAERLPRMRSWLPGFVVACIGLPLLQRLLDRPLDLTSVGVKVVGTLALAVFGWFAVVKAKGPATS